MLGCTNEALLKASGLEIAMLWRCADDKENLRTLSARLGDRFDDTFAIFISTLG